MLLGAKNKEFLSFFWGEIFMIKVNNRELLTLIDQQQDWPETIE